MAVAQARLARAASPTVKGAKPPYRFARLAFPAGKAGRAYWDLGRDGDDARLARYGLPKFDTPEQLAAWLGLPIGKVAWLLHRGSDNRHRAASTRAAHYHYRWIAKRSGGLRLIEAPKPLLKAVQTKILREILDKVPLHAAAHGFRKGRSIVSNAQPHVGQRVLLKLDLESFYPSVSFNRVTAIFRSLGYSREAALWLSRLTTTAPPRDFAAPAGSGADVWPYYSRHLPQGAPTSPALANLSAYSLDVRLAGMARSFDARYTRYADDLSFSGPERFLKSLPVFIPLVQTIIRSERFRINRRKRKVLRNSVRQTVTGVVVNSRTNVSRQEFDRLKAVLTNCVRRGPASQNREQHPDFAACLAGKIAHVTQLNGHRGARLMALYRKIDWRK